MSLSILITQCMQRDFISPLHPHAPLPNKLHVGHQEARRLLGARPEQGPLSQLMTWARAQSEDELAILHIRDWHDPDDPTQRAHLELFGEHCIQGTPGAQLVLELDDGVHQRAGERFVDSISLNDFVGTTLTEQLGGLISGHEPGDVRIGVIGVWTEAKVSFLLYELLTRYGITALATCSALTASASRTQHFNALEQLKKILGVAVFDSVGEFAQWLAPGSTALEASGAATGSSAIELVGDIDGLVEDHRALVSFLYRESTKVELGALSGGFSGARVYRARSWDALGHEQSATVLKLGERGLIGKERRAFEQVELVLGNDAPSVLGFADFGQFAGIKYAYAAMGQQGVRTFKALYESQVEQSRIDAVLEEAFDKILGRFYTAARYERLELLDYYTFSPEYADGVRAKVAEVMGTARASAGTLTSSGMEVMNVADFYERELDGLLELARRGEYHFVSYVHGDLNGANILLDGRDNVWLIDFFHAHRGHILRDVAKLENDLLYIFTPIGDEAELAQALEITKALASVRDLRAPLGALPDGITAPQLVRAWATLRTLRGIAARLCRSERAPEHLHIALLRYAVHTQWFDESSELQRRWALMAAGSHAQRIVDKARKSDVLWVGWIELERELYRGRLGLTICPGRQDRDRDLGEDLATLSDEQVSLLVGLLPEHEMRWAGVTGMSEEARRAGIDYVHEPIQDQRPPTMAAAIELVTRIRARLMAEEGSVVVHCMGGLGRSGTIVAATLVTFGVDGRRAIELVRQARGPRAIETRAQERLVEDFAAAWEAHSC